MIKTKAQIVSGDNKEFERILDASPEYLSGLPAGSVVLPGFCDVHVHFREPGFSYKETIASGSTAAARGGYTDVCSMPNLRPVPDSVEHLKVQLDIIGASAVINVHPYGALTVNEEGKEPADLDGLASKVAAFSDDGRGVQSEEMMKSLMLKTASLGKIIAAHCEDDSLVRGGYVHDGEYARLNGHKGISSASEYVQIDRDLKLVRETGAAYHVCHVSCAESVDLIRKAKKEGLNVTCETAPHYLALSDGCLKDEGRFKMNPPIRSESDRLALIEGALDGTIDMVATDHAPHSAEEKARGLAGSAFGVTGLETAFQVLYSRLVREGIMSLDRLVELMCYSPRKRFGLSLNGFSVWNLDEPYVINPADFVSKGKSTPFEGMRVYGKNVLTVCNGKAVYRS